MNLQQIGQQAQVSSAIASRGSPNFVDGYWPSFDSDVTSNYRIALSVISVEKNDQVNNTTGSEIHSQKSDRLINLQRSPQKAPNFLQILVLSAVILGRILTLFLHVDDVC